MEIASRSIIVAEGEIIRDGEKIEEDLEEDTKAEIVPALVRRGRKYPFGFQN